MAEEQLYFTAQKQPHAIEAGGFVLDLYRLICMVSASQDVATLGLTSPAIAMMQGGFFRAEVTRILISCAAGLRIRFDQAQGPPEDQNPDCGKLFPNWETDPNKVEVLTLREACNKIIHATDIKFDVVIPDAEINPDEEGAYYLPHLYLYGSKNRNDWRAELSLIHFARRGAVDGSNETGLRMSIDEPLKSNGAVGNRSAGNRCMRLSRGEFAEWTSSLFWRALPCSWAKPSLSGGA
ncbi:MULTISPECIES: hypothetical protein [Bradyrhizobium]|uniref:hypothetical protein n=1 Tax=Bradyrhizobium TaxID=374 RepID=UPI00293E2879|nr:hypothetical protein [Bradyrhizobium sp. NDS-1]WOH72327.1 hypothetical protein RX330_29210 [Bradyrhizobium sp. NDS-1]